MFFFLYFKIYVSFKTVKDTLSQHTMPLPTSSHFRVMVTDKDQHPMGSSYYE